MRQCDMQFNNTESPPDTHNTGKKKNEHKYQESGNIAIPTDIKILKAQQVSMQHSIWTRWLTSVRNFERSALIVNPSCPFQTPYVQLPPTRSQSIICKR